MGARVKLVNIGRRLSPRTFRRFVNLAGPIRNSGVKVVHISDDWLQWTLRLPMSRKTRNYVGTHYGGTLYSSMDPHFMLAWMHILGPGYIVWDKAATIRFRTPSRSHLTGQIHIAPEEVEEVRARCEREQKFDCTHHFQWLAPDGTVVAEVDKVLHFRKKTPAT